MFERMCLDRWSDNPKACLQKLGDKDSCICIEASWLVDHLEVCLEEQAEEQSEVLTFRDSFYLQLSRFSCETNRATIILLGNIDSVRFLSLNNLFWTFIVKELQQHTFSPNPRGKCLIRGDIGHDSLTAVSSKANSHRGPIDPGNHGGFSIERWMKDSSWIAFQWDAILGAWVRWIFMNMVLGFGNFALESSPCKFPCWLYSLSK